MKEKLGLSFQIFHFVRRTGEGRCLQKGEGTSEQQDGGEKAGPSGTNSGTELQVEGDSTVREMARQDKDGESDGSADSTAIPKRSLEGRGTNGDRKKGRGGEGKRVKRHELTEEAE